jgi:hypothetical protein
MKRSPRGFVLVIVMIVAASVAGAAILLVVSAGQGRLTAARVEGGEVAAGIADAGLARVRATLATREAGDFDLDLDPNLRADCAQLSGGTAPTCALADGCNRPKFTDGDTATIDGLAYTRVAFNGGAYFVRYDDDDDDQADPGTSYTEWAPFTGYQPGPGGNCIEGRTIPAGGQNPLRDRNRAIWVTAIGIYPGTDPATARQRVVLRRLQTAVLPNTVAGIRVRGDIIQENAGNFFACSPIGSVESTGNLSGQSAAQACMCGSSRARGTVTNFSQCNTANICADTTKVPVPVGCASGRAPVGGKTISAPSLGNLNAAGSTGTDFYIDWSRPCVFFVENNKDTLWVWDANAQRGPSGTTPKGQPCRNFEGKGLGLPTPNPSKLAGSVSETNVNDWGACWTPVVWGIENADARFGATTNTTCLDGPGTGPNKCCGVGGASREVFFDKEDSGAGGNRCIWRPNKAAATQTFAVTWAASAGGATESYTLPDWSTCSIRYPPFPETGVSPSTISCGADCDGTETVFRHIGSGANAMWWFDIDDAADAAALPVGVYIYPNNLDIDGPAKDGFAIPAAGSLPSPSSPMAGWPNATLFTPGSFSGGNRRVWLGSGQDSGTGTLGDEPRHASLIASSYTINGGGNFYIGGSLYSTGAIDWTGNGDTVCWGEIQAMSTFKVKGNGRFEWLYATPLQTPPSGYTGPPLTVPLAR